MEDDVSVSNGVSNDTLSIAARAPVINRAGCFSAVGIEELHSVLLFCTCGGQEVTCNHHEWNSCRVIPRGI